MHLSAGQARHLGKRVRNELADMGGSATDKFLKVSIRSCLRARAVDNTHKVHCVARPLGQSIAIGLAAY
jgi:hypothetical protein